MAFAPKLHLKYQNMFVMYDVLYQVVTPYATLTIKLSQHLYKQDKKQMIYSASHKQFQMVGYRLCKNIKRENGTKMRIYRSFYEILEYYNHAIC